MIKSDSDLLLVWKRRVEDVKKLGYSAPKYCKKKGLTLRRYYYWRNKIKTMILPDESLQPPQGDFLELAFSSERSEGSSGLIVSFGDGIKIIPKRGFNEAEFVRVAKLLRSLGQC